MNATLAEEHPFISHLANLVREKDRGALAALRRGLGRPPGSVRAMDRYVLRYLSSDAGEKQENAYYLVAALFAYWHQGKDSLTDGAPVNLGASLWAMVKKAADEDTSNRSYPDKWKEAEKRIEKRLVALLNCHRDDLPAHLRHTISLLKSKDIPVNWTQLLWDVQKWHWESRDVQRGWARKFWRGYSTGTNPDETPSQNEENKEGE